MPVDPCRASAGIRHLFLYPLGREPGTPKPSLGMVELDAVFLQCLSAGRGHPFKKLKRIDRVGRAPRPRIRG